MVTVMVKVKSLEILVCKKIQLYFYLQNYNSIISRPCKGRGIVSSTVKENITIPKGVDSGVNLRISKKGNINA